MNIDYIIGLVISAVAFLISVSCHEFAHGYLAYKMGDPTAKFSKRLSLNPLRHFDLFGILFFLVFRFGWAKGVPIDPRYFKDKKKGMVYSALAGPVTNVILALISLVFLNFIYKINSTSEILFTVFTWIAVFLVQMVSVNAMLAIFNLIPIYPLDGARILKAFIRISKGNKKSAYYINVISNITIIVITMIYLKMDI